MLLYLLQINIIIKQVFLLAFDGARRYFDTDMSLLPVAGNGLRFAEFKLQRFIVFVFMFEPLKQFFKFDTFVM